MIMPPTETFLILRLLVVPSLNLGVLCMGEKTCIF